MTFTAVVTSHANPVGLVCVIGQLVGQTRPPDEVIALVSGSRRRLVVPPQIARFSRIICQDRSDWGHEKRAEGLALATGDWVGFFNDDDSYAPTYVEEMLAAGVGADLVLCGWAEGRGPAEPPSHTTSGNFIVRRLLARRVGYGHRAYDADNRFLAEVLATSPPVAEVDRLLYRHNAQPWME